jgi:uncharacterized protein YgiM (DUF1202 family)
MRRFLLAALLGLFVLVIAAGITWFLMGDNLDQLLPTQFRSSQEGLPSVLTNLDTPTPATEAEAEPVSPPDEAQPDVPAEATPLEPSPAEVEPADPPTPTAVVVAPPADEPTSAPPAVDSPDPVAVDPVAVTVNVAINLRESPSTDADVVATVNPGETINIVGRNAAGDWYVLDNGAWVFGELLEEQPSVPQVTPAPTPVLGAVTARTNADANLRSGPGTEFEIAGGATFNTEIVIVGRNEAGDWYRLQDGSWIFADLVDGDVSVPIVSATDPLPATPSDSAPTTPPVQPAGATVTVNTGANLREGPGTDFPILDAIAPGEEVVVTGQNEAGDWYRLDTGQWIFAALVDNAPASLPVIPAPEAVVPTVTPTATPVPVPDITATRNVRDAVINADTELYGAPSTDSEVVGRSTTGAVVTVVGRNEAGDWYQLDNSAWVPASVVDNVSALDRLLLPVVRS